MRRALAVLAAAAMASCQTPPAPPPPDEPIYSTALANVEVVTSPGGVTAWLVSQDFVPMISMEVAWPGGTAIEPPGKEGVGWVLSYMMNEGAGDLDTSAYGARMDDLNMEFGCAAWTDWQHCSFSTLSDKADEAFEMVRLAFAKLRLDDEPFERAKREYIVRLEQEQTDPKAVAGRTMSSLLIPGHPYARMPTRQSVNAISKTDARRLMRQVMTRDQLLVVVVGDITAEELKPRLDVIFGSLPETSLQPDVPAAAANRAPAEPAVRLLPQPQTLVLFSGPGIRREDPDFYAAYILNFILGGGGFSSRLTTELRDKRGLTYSVGTGLSIQPRLQRWTGSVSTMNDKADTVVSLVRETIDRLGREGPTEQEMQDAKAYVTGAFPLAFDSNMKIARNLLGFRQDGMGPEYVARRNSYFEAVTLDDLKRVASKYMRSQDFAFVLVGQPRTD